MLRSGLAGVCCALAASGASGQDLSPPSWRGGPMSTYERWDFSGGAGGGAPDVLPYLNPYGTPNLYPQAGTTWSATTGAGVPPRSDVWQIGQFSSLGATVDNLGTPVPNGAVTGCKQMVVSITFFGGEPEVTINPIAGHGSFTINLDNEVFLPLGNGWTFARYDYTLFATASPDRESVLTTNVESDPSWIDYLAIDSRVVPEPGAVGLAMGFGVVALRRRRGG